MAEESELLKTPAPTLYGIIGFKLLKGALFLALAIVMYCLSDNDLPAEVRELMKALRVHPGNKFFLDLAEQAGLLTETNVLWAAAATLFYSLFAWVEGIGMIFRVSWAGWLAIGESAHVGAIAFTGVLAVGFALHNITEGFGIAEPLLGRRVLAVYRLPRPHR